MATDKKVSELIINKLTKAQYDSATKNPDELYLVKDAKITADDLDDAVLADYVKNTDYASSGTAGVIKTSATYGNGISASGVLTSTTRTYDQYLVASNSFFISRGTLENVLNERKYLMPEYTLELPTTGEANKLYLTPATEQPDVEATASGKTVELTDASEGDLIDWTIKGDTEQASPSGTNLFNSATASINTYIGWDTGTTTTQNNVFTSDFIEVKPNINYEVKGRANWITQTYWNDKKAYISGSDNVNILSVPSNAKYVRITGSMSAMNNISFDIASPRPNSPQEVKTVTGRNVVSVVGKNLFDKDKVIIGKRLYNGELIDGSSSFTSDYIKVKGGDTYVKNSPTEDAYHRMSMYDSNKMFVLESIYNAYRLPENVAYIRICGYLNEMETTQLEKGSVATPYQPYSGQEVELDLGKNIFNVATSQEYKWFGDTGIIYGSADPNVVSDFIPVQVGETYTISGSLGSLTNKVASYNNDESFKTLLIKNNTTRTFVADAPYIRVAIGSGNAIAIKNTIQLERGSVATPYVPFVSISRNLFNKYDYKFINSYVDTTSGKLTAGGTGIVSVYIPCEPNTTYTVSKQNGTNNRFCVFETAVEPANGVTVLSSVGTREGENNNTSLTITTGSNAQYLGAFIRASSTTPALDVQLNSVQIEKGSSATSYQPFYNTPELCKLGDYQDRIFKDGNTWKIEKKVGKKVFNGTENWEQSNVAYKTTDTIGYISSTNVGYSDYFAFSYFESGISTKLENGHFGYNNLKETLFRKDDSSSVSDFKTWLGTHPVSIYYALNAPAVTEITHQPLIDQLNALETLATIKGYNMVTTDTQSVQPFLEFGYFRPDPSVTKDEWLWVENHYEQLGGERRYTHNLSVNHHTAQGHWDYAFTIVGKDANHYTQLAQVAYYLFREHAGLTIPVSGTYTEGNTVYLLTKITASSLNQVTIEMRKLSDGSVRSISTGAVQVQDTIS